MNVEDILDFFLNYIYLLKDILIIPDEINCYNRTEVDGLGGLCIFLKRFAYPCRYSDMIPIFGRSVQELCLVFYYVMDTLYNFHGNLLTCLNQQWLSPVNLESFCNAFHQSGAALENCWGLVDEQCDLFVDQMKTKWFCTMGIRGFTPSNSNHWFLRMA